MSLYDVPQWHLARATDYVFGRADGTKIKSIKTAWKLACRRAGIKGLNPQDLRREAGSTLKESGMPDHYTQQVLRLARRSPKKMHTEMHTAPPPR